MNPADADLLSLDEVVVLPRHARLLSGDFARRRRVLPFYQEHDCLWVATDQPEDDAVRRALERVHPGPIHFTPAEPDSLSRALERVYGGAAGRGGPVAPDDSVRLVDQLIDDACLQLASDIHLEPGPDHIRIRFRVDGELEPAGEIPATAYPGVVGRVKMLARLDIAEKRIPQDGQITHKSGRNGRLTAIRVATLPTRHGEKITLRILGQHAAASRLDQLGMDPDTLGRFRRAIERPHGLVALTGPTGSGKTTTMYAALRHLTERGNDSLLTIEDPVECELPGIIQVDVSGERLDYPTALRSSLRHDPDVLLIGEIRDPESADMAVRAALTGHLVLTTLHTRDAAGAITRLLDLGVERYLLGATLHCVAAQRLVRKLCAACRQPGTLLPREALALGLPADDIRPVHRPQGCPRCAGRGYTGRIALYEVFTLDDTALRLLAETGGEDALRAHARSQHQPTLRDAALQALANAQTSPEELLTVVGA